MRALMIGYYGAYNLGDDLMLLCLREWLARQGVECTVIAADAGQVERLYGLPAIQHVPLLGEYAWYTAWVRAQALGPMRSMWNHQALIVGGGDCIREDVGWKQLFLSVEYPILAILMGKPVYILSAGIGVPRTKRGRAMVGWVLRRCKKIYVRDQRSLEVCRDLGAGEQTRLLPDIVNSLPHQFNLAGMDLTPTQPRGRRYVVINVRDTPNLYGQYALTEERLENLAAGFNHLISVHGLDLVFLPYGGSAVGDDNRMHRSIVAKMPGADRVMVREWTSNVSEIAELLGHAHCLVAMRLHAAIMALAFAVPCAVMPYDHKVQELIRARNLRNVILPETLDYPDRLRAVLDATVMEGYQAERRMEADAWASATLEWACQSPT